MRKVLATTGLTLAGLAAAAGVGNASAIDNNEHANQANEGGINVSVSDVLTNAPVLNGVHVLDKGVHVADQGVANKF